MERDHLGEICVHERIILKWIKKKLDVRVWNGFIWLNIGTSNEFHKRRRDSWPAERLLASEMDPAPWSLLVACVRAGQNQPLVWDSEHCSEFFSYRLGGTWDTGGELSGNLQNRNIFCRLRKIRCRPMLASGPQVGNLDPYHFVPWLHTSVSKGPLHIPVVTDLMLRAEWSVATPLGSGIISRVNLATNGRDVRASIPTGDKGETRHRHGNDRGGFGRRNLDVEVGHEMKWM